MELAHSTLQVAYIVSVVTSVALCAVLWYYREKSGVVPLFCYVLAGLFWGGIQLLSVTIDDVTISIALHRLLYLAIAFGAASLFVFALEYTGREQYLERRTYLALSVHPLAVAVFAFVDPGGHFLGAIEADPSMAIGVMPDYGILMLVHLVYTYGLVVASAFMFVDLLYRSRSLYRGQSLALIGGSVLPASGPLLQIAGGLAFDPTPIAIPIASGLFTVAIVRYRLIDLVPIARDRVLDTVNDGVFVVDDDDRLIDINSAGERILRTIGIGDTDDDGALVGRSFPSLLPNTALRDRYETVVERGEAETFEVSIGHNHFQVTATPIEDGRDRHVGWLVIAHDVTDRKRHEQRLEEQNERLERFASLVSHDLRNPLTVAGGYLDLARETDDPGQHLDEVEAAHERMEAIIDDVLALAREGKTVTEPQSIELAVLADRAWQSVTTDGATLRIRSSEPIRADPDRARRLLENLFRNAIEHGSTGSRPRADDSVEHATPASADGDDSRTTATGEALELVVGVDRGDDGTGRTVYVEDDGVGIPPAKRDRILEDGYSTGDEGTGFGLSIVQQIARAHGWSVAVTEGTAGGARFEFTSSIGECPGA